MRSLVERLDRFRTSFIKIFLIAFGLIFGFWTIVQFLFALMRPRYISSIGASRPVWMRFINFMKAINPAIEVSAVIGLIAFGALFVSWLIYQKRLAKDPAVKIAVRDERVRLIWLLAFRKTVVAVVVLQLAFYLLNSVSPFFLKRIIVTPREGFFLTFFVFVMMSLGTFLSLDRRAAKSPNESENMSSPLLFRLTGFETMLTRKATPVLRLYIGWHSLIIIGMIYWNWRLMHISGGRDNLRDLRELQIFSAVRFLWIAVLAVLLFLLLRSLKKASRTTAKTLVPDDDRVCWNWLRAYRFSFILVLFLQFAWASNDIVNLIITRMPKISMFMLSVLIYLSNMYLTLLAGVVGLLGSYLYFDRKE